MAVGLNIAFSLSFEPDQFIYIKRWTKFKCFSSDGWEFIAYIEVKQRYLQSRPWNWSCCMERSGKVTAS